MANQKETGEEEGVPCAADVCSSPAARACFTCRRPATLAPAAHSPARGAFKELPGIEPHVDNASCVTLIGMLSDSSIDFTGG